MPAIRQFIQSENSDIIKTLSRDIDAQMWSSVRQALSQNENYFNEIPIRVPFANSVLRPDWNFPFEVCPDTTNQKKISILSSTLGTENDCQPILIDKFVVSWQYLWIKTINHLAVFTLNVILGGIRFSGKKLANSSLNEFTEQVDHLNLLHKRHVKNQWYL